MKGEFNAYLLLALDKRVQNWIVDWSTDPDFPLSGNFVSGNDVIEWSPVGFLRAIPSKYLKALAPTKKQEIRKKETQ